MKLSYIGDWANNNMCFNYTSSINLKILCDNINSLWKTSKALWEAFRAKCCQKLAFWRANFQEKIKLMESSRNMKFAYIL